MAMLHRIDDKSPKISNNQNHQLKGPMTKPLQQSRFKLGSTRAALLFASFLAGAFLHSTPLLAQGTINAIGSLSDVPAGGGVYNYTITMQNAGSSTSPIGSFWYAWVPGQFYLPTAPSALLAPSGWTATVVSLGGASSIQYVASAAGSYIQPGSSLNFGFSSTDTPSVLAGNAPNFPGTPIGTTVVYGAGLFSLPSQTMVVNSVPEPAASILLSLSALSFLIIRRRS